MVPEFSVSLWKCRRDRAKLVGAAFATKSPGHSMDRNFPRLIDTLTVLQRTGKLTTPQVSERLAARGHLVTARTVQRDLEELSSVYPLDCDRSCKPYSWSWRLNAPRVSIPGMDWPEAISFHLLSTYLAGVLPPSVEEGIAPYVTEAQRKLSQHFDKLPLRRWPERVRVVQPGQAVLAPATSRSVHLALTEAVLLGRKARIRYQALESQQAKSYIISPLGLVQYGVVFYLPVRYEGHDDVRTIALHRVQRAELLDAASGIESFDLSAWLAEGALGFGGTELIALALRFHNGAGEILAQTPLAQNQEVSVGAAGEQVIRASVLDTLQLRRWILSYGRAVTVLAPDSLRKWISAEHQAAANFYGP